VAIPMARPNGHARSFTNRAAGSSTSASKRSALAVLTPHGNDDDPCVTDAGAAGQQPDEFEIGQRHPDGLEVVEALTDLY
jgi:hypothetical protein